MVKNSFSELSDKEALRILKEDAKAVKGLKEENKDLREKIEALLVNNKEFANLVKLLDTKVEELENETRKKYRYSYEDGGWKDDEEFKRGRLELKNKKITLNDINRQLKDILSILEKRKKE